MGQEPARFPGGHPRPGPGLRATDRRPQGQDHSEFVELLQAAIHRAAPRQTPAAQADLQETAGRSDRPRTTYSRPGPGRADDRVLRDQGRLLAPDAATLSTGTTRSPSAIRSPSSPRFGPRSSSIDSAGPRNGGDEGGVNRPPCGVGLAGFPAHRFDLRLGGQDVRCGVPGLADDRRR